MCAHGYQVPVHLCHGAARGHAVPRLTFPAAVPVVWVKTAKISVNGRVLVYDFSVSKPWAGKKCNVCLFQGPPRHCWMSIQAAGRMQGTALTPSPDALYGDAAGLYFCL